jgi:hypothetical protein
MIRLQITHNDHVAVSANNDHTSCFTYLDHAHKDQVTFKLNSLDPHSHNTNSESDQPFVAVSFTESSPLVIQVPTTYINNKPKLRANIEYTGTIANAKNSLKLNFSKNHSHEPFLSKKYISQNRGENIIYNQRYIHLIINTNHNAIIKMAYISIKRKSITTLITTSAIVLTVFLISSKFNSSR